MSTLDKFGFLKKCSRSSHYCPSGKENAFPVSGDVYTLSSARRSWYEPGGGHPYSILQTTVEKTSQNKRISSWQSRGFLLLLHGHSLPLFRPTRSTISAFPSALACSPLINQFILSFKYLETLITSGTLWPGLFSWWQAIFWFLRTACKPVFRPRMRVGLRSSDGNSVTEGKPKWFTWGLSSFLP